VTVISKCGSSEHVVSVFTATKVELYVGDVSLAIDDRLLTLNQARFTRLGYIHLLFMIYSPPCGSGVRVVFQNRPTPFPGWMS